MKWLLIKWTLWSERCFIPAASTFSKQCSSLRSLTKPTPRPVTDVQGSPRVCKPSGDFEVDADPCVARSLTAGFLGIDESEVTPAQEDEVMAEFCNMTCGSALSSLGRVEYFRLETPETSRPPAFSPAIDGVRRAFLLEGGTLSVCLRVDFDRS